jgi:flagellar protein FlbD
LADGAYYRPQRRLLLAGDAGHSVQALTIVKELSMIKLTRLDGESFILNAELIKYVEARPDTFITLVGGDRIVVSESSEMVMERTLKYHQAKKTIPSPPVF